MDFSVFVIQKNDRQHQPVSKNGEKVPISFSIKRLLIGANQFLKVEKNEELFACLCASVWIVQLLTRATA